REGIRENAGVRCKMTARERQAFKSTEVAQTTAVGKELESIRRTGREAGREEHFKFAVQRRSPCNLNAIELSFGRGAVDLVLKSASSSLCEVPDDVEKPWRHTRPKSAIVDYICQECPRSAE